VRRHHPRRQRLRPHAHVPPPTVHLGCAAMTGPELLAGAYHLLLSELVRSGRALHYTELADVLGMAPSEGLAVQQALTESGIPIFTQAGTDYLAGFTPFSNIPTHCRITVDGEQRWYAICAVEALAVSWLFPDRQVTIDSPCLDCGDPVRIVMRDGAVLELAPATTVVHTNIPAARWSEDWAYA
ncbi:MAG: organomercurial lyase, partial [Gemmatimonadales bacterium]